MKPDLWNGARAKYLQARWREDIARQNIAWWMELFEYIRDKCPFMLGDNDRKWRADLEWIVTASNLPKILEGKYAVKGEKRKWFSSDSRTL